MASCKKKVKLLCFKAQIQQRLNDESIQTMAAWVEYVQKHTLSKIDQEHPYLTQPRGETTQHSEHNITLKFWHIPLFSKLGKHGIIPTGEQDYNSF